MNIKLHNLVFGLCCNDPITAVVAGIGAAASVAGTISQIKAQKSQRKAARAQARIAELQRSRERRDTIRRARIARAQIESQVGSAGLLASSTAIGGTGSIQSQLASNLSFLDQTGALNTEANRQLERAAGFQTQASIFQGVSDISTGFLGESPFKAAGRSSESFLNSQ